MISSEVQRTLVKSPPELWAEISDPESLGRHLGELGEIRITRSEPEQLVEWESDGATGTIAIKASGWGTRVTLTAARELSAEAAQDIAEAPSAEEASPSQPEAEQQAQPSQPEAEPEAAVAPEPEAEQQAEPEPVLAAESVPGADEAMPPPATPAGAMAAWALQESETLPPASGADADAFGGVPAEAHGEASAEQSASPEQTFADDAAQAFQAPEHRPEPPRRGFFARLFGRRQKASKPAFSPTTAAGAGADVELTIAREAARRRLEATLAAPPVPQAEARADAYEPAEDQQDEAPEQIAAEAPEHATAEPAEDQQDEGPEQIAAEAPEHATAETPEPVADLSAELRAAEETAAEEVTAVLTAVLDRLGSAHHRPFSRG